MATINAITAPRNLDYANASNFAVKLNKACNSSDIIHLDMSKVEFICSAGIGVIIHAWNSLEKPRQNLVIINPSDFVMDILENCNLTRIFSIIETKND